MSLSRRTIRICGRFIAQNIYLRHIDKQKLLEELRRSSALRSSAKCSAGKSNHSLEQNIQSSTQEHIARTRRIIFSGNRSRSFMRSCGENESADDDLASTA
jgi:hypothetical protein